MLKQIVLQALIFSLGMVGSACAQSDESLDWNQLPTTPNASHHASVLATFVLPHTEMCVINPNIDAADLSHAANNGYADTKIPGIGSALVPVPNQPGEFLMMTDRGPNVDNLNLSAKSLGKIFPLKSFTPAIVRVRLVNGQIVPIQSTPIVDTQGKPVTGISNNKDDELPYAQDGGFPIPFNPNGLDTEAMQLLPNGQFLVAEEYGPSIAVVDATGKVLVRYVPEGKGDQGASYPVKALLPSILSSRRANRGFENLAVTPDGKTAYAILQSPMGDAKDKLYAKSRVVRILQLDVSEPTNAKVTGMYLVLQNEKSAYPETDKQKDLKYSDAVALDQARLLLLERATKKVKLMVADLSQATNILAHPQANNLTLESEGEYLERFSIRPAETEEVFDSRDVFLQIDTDKLEGLAVLNAGVVALSNDNDFGVGEDNQNMYPSKVWVVRLGKSLSR